MSNENKKIKVNKIRCKNCGDIIESKTVHDFKTCKCGNVSVDGGKEYLNELYIAKCINCGKKIIWINKDYVYPDIVAEGPNADMPDSVKQLYDEAGLIYNLDKLFFVFSYSFFPIHLSYIIHFDYYR